MERAARLIKNSRLSRQVLSEDDLARAVWPAAVGKAIAAHTVRIKLVRRTLVIEVEDAIWQRQLYQLSPQILDRLRKLTGSDSIQELEFRIAIPRRLPQRVENQKTELWPAKAGSRD
jgi:predicted nucleic acid-binding Zn ribbon protein